MEIVNNSVRDADGQATEPSSPLKSDEKGMSSGDYQTPQKSLSLDTSKIEGSASLQELLNQRLQKSRSSKKLLQPTVRTDGHSPNSISSTPERPTTGQRYAAEWTTPGGQAIQFNFMSKNIPTTPEVVRRSSTHFPAQNYDAVWHGTSPWRPKNSSPLRQSDRGGANYGVDVGEVKQYMFQQTYSQEEQFYHAQQQQMMHQQQMSYFNGNQQYGVGDGPTAHSSNQMALMGEHDGSSMDEWE
jgi:hypothetical protein